MRRDSISCWIEKKDFFHFWKRTHFNAFSPPLREKGKAEQRKEKKEERGKERKERGKE